MDEQSAAAAALHIDQCIERYIGECRAGVAPFLSRHFTLAQTWQLQRPTLLRDVPVSLLNLAWSIPYLSAKKVAELIDKLGFPFLLRALEHLPSGWHTAYQRRIEALMGKELLGWDLDRSSPVPERLLRSLKTDPLLELLTGRELEESRSSGGSLMLRRAVHRFSEGRAIVTDVSGSLFMMLCGWWFFGKGSLNLEEMGHGFAERKAYDEATSNFFLGSGAGTVFYDLFPPSVSESDTRFYTVLLGLGFFLVTGIFTVFSDPVRRALGLHRWRLTALIDELERELLVVLHRGLKAKLLNSSQTGGAHFGSGPLFGREPAQPFLDQSR